MRIVPARDAMPRGRLQVASEGETGLASPGSIVGAAALFSRCACRGDTRVALGGGKVRWFPRRWLYTYYCTHMRAIVLQRGCW